MQVLTRTSESTLCSAPVKRRGLVTVDRDGRAAHGHARMTVLGGAFNRAVVTLRLATRGGHVIRLHPRPIGVQGADAHIRSFRYVAKAVGGSMCLERLETVGAGGRVFWQAHEGELVILGLGCKSRSA